VREFSGTEPLVGEIVGLRTFRVDDTGTLLPLYSNGAWYDGDNVASCSPPTGSHPRGEHPVPSGDCECGFYAYSSLAAVASQRQSRFVLAVVSCWGNVVAGTLGFRAEHARIDALWVSPRAPSWVRKRLAVRYPSARQFGNTAAMLAEYPLTRLDCYEAPQHHPVSRLSGLALAVAVLGLGLVPLGVLRGADLLWDMWVVATAVAVGVTAWLAAGVHWAGHLAAALVMCGVVAWLLAPLFGAAGWLLRVPLLRGVAVGGGGLLISMLPRYFPVVSTPRERAFCGVRP
jgi:hypothetical protein